MNKKSLITNKGYYLGITKNNEKVYLVKPSWDCDWYWGFGYLEYYNNTGRPTLRAHTHWDYFIKEKNTYPKAALEDEFKYLTLSENSLWEFCDYMQSFYTLSNAARLFTYGNSQQTEPTLNLQNKAEAKKINNILLPKLFEMIEDLFKKEAIKTDTNYSGKIFYKDSGKIFYDDSENTWVVVNPGEAKLVEES